MQETVRVERRGDIAVITIDNPPVNALSHSVRVGLLEQLPRLEAAPDVKVIVLACAGATFSAGADVREFGSPPKDPIMAVAMDALDRSSKLTVAAIHGQALGGGLETALVFDYRCATPDAKVGLPEIKLGLFPGGGGTQRLPRLIGIAAAADMILSGDTVPAAKAKQLGVIDEILDGDILDSAMAYAQKLVAQNAPHRRLSARSVSVPEGFSFAERRARALKDTRGLPAAAAAVDAIEAGTRLSFADGLAEERRLFLVVRGSTEAAAMRHLFMAEREVAKIPDLPKDTTPRTIDSACVVGAGTMGGGIAISLANAGFPVTLVETTEAALDRGWRNVHSIYDSQVERGRLRAEERDKRLALITRSLNLDDAAGADLIIECVFEDMQIKRNVFGRLGSITRQGAILATNTSALDVNRIAEASGRPQDVVGLHFFSPANIMRLVEVVRGARTAPNVLASAMALCKRLGKIGVVSGVCDGFIGNRMLRGYRREAELLVLEGASPQRVDKALTGFGMAMGVHAMGDMAGLDIAAAGRKRMRAEGKLGDDPRLGAVQDRLVEMGRLGLKTGAGIYRYEPGSRTPLPDPEVEGLIEAEAKRLGVKRREISDQEIIDRCLLPLVNEGARIIEEGIALGAADIDVVYCNGYGFPRHRGGPMFWADTVGIAKVLAMIEQFARELGRYWEPAPLIVQLAKARKAFADMPRGSRTAGQ
ncbi:MAG TPA: 3-hydroxyacyl-CoA dehydrogenase NAD-binding domain-containing protein [Rhizomicrobium sp.]|nr:3-hydroxyacyl-CoA dehydrogenase NAD-binding domain-containing protein [Rhizomicrobium sp.]